MFDVMCVGFDISFASFGSMIDIIVVIFIYGGMFRVILDRFGVKIARFDGMVMMDVLFCS